MEEVFMCDVTRSNLFVLVTVPQSKFENVVNLDSKIRKILKKYVYVNPQMAAIKRQHVERYMADDGFDSDVCFKIRSNSQIDNIRKELDLIK
jgi:hypothetical protein